MKSVTGTIRWLKSHERQARGIAEEFLEIAEAVAVRPAKAPRLVEKLNAIGALMLTAADDMEDLRALEEQL